MRLGPFDSPGVDDGGAVAARLLHRDPRLVHGTAALKDDLSSFGADGLRFVDEVAIKEETVEDFGIAGAKGNSVGVGDEWLCDGDGGGGVEGGDGERTRVVIWWVVVIQ